MNNDNNNNNNNNNNLLLNFNNDNLNINDSMCDMPFILNINSNNLKLTTEQLIKNEAKLLGINLEKCSQISKMIEYIDIIKREKNYFNIPYDILNINFKVKKLCEITDNLNIQINKLNSNVKFNYNISTCNYILGFIYFAIFTSIFIIYGYYIFK